MKDEKDIMIELNTSVRAMAVELSEIRRQLEKKNERRSTHRSHRADRSKPRADRRRTDNDRRRSQA